MNGLLMKEEKEIKIEKRKLLIEYMNCGYPSPYKAQTKKQRKTDTKLMVVRW